LSLRGIIFAGLLVVLVGSIAVRAATHSDSSANAALTGSSVGSGAHSFAGGTTGSSPTTVDPSSTAPAETKDSLLPYLTEGSFFGIIGFALGFTSRKIVKLMLILIALVFAAVQGLAFAGVVSSVDWGKGLKLANDLVFNLNEHESWIEFLKAKIPSAGAFMGGFLLGFRKG
jgi:uncharacterized membrane protein (Fun14 family)